MRDTRDIVDILRSWETRDDVPKELSGFLSIAADEIAGLRVELKDLRREIEAHEPQF